MVFIHLKKEVFMKLIIFLSFLILSSCSLLIENADYSRKSEENCSISCELKDTSLYSYGSNHCRCELTLEEKN